MLSMIQNGNRPDWGAGSFADAQGQRDKDESFSHQLIQVAKIFNVRNPTRSADHVAGVGFIQEHIRAGIIHAEINCALIDDVLCSLPVQPRLVG